MDIPKKTQRERVKEELAKLPPEVKKLVSVLPEAQGRRPNHSGSVFCRTGEDFYRFAYIDALTGKRHTITLKDVHGNKIDNEPDALIAADGIIAKQHAILNQETSAKIAASVAERQGKITRCHAQIEATWTAFLEKKPRVAGKVEKERSVRHFVEWLKTNYPKIKTVADVTTDAAIAYSNARWTEGISAKTFTNCMSDLRQVFKVLLPGGGVFDGIEPPKDREDGELSHQQDREAFTPEEIKKIRDFIAKQDHIGGMNIEHLNEWDGMILVGLCYGLRLEDAALLEWESIKDGFIHLTPHKTKKSSGIDVDVPILPPIADMLASHERSSRYVFTLNARRYLQNRNRPCADFLLILKKAGIQTTDEIDGLHRKNRIARRGFHSLRHSAASILSDAGVPIETIRAILGHTTKEMTQHYACHRTLEQKARELKHIETVLNGENLPTPIAPQVMEGDGGNLELAKMIALALCNNPEAMNKLATDILSKRDIADIKRLAFSA
ncbi:MAG: site-specific integrase [Lentisphaeria bacterium]|nr:site-specific integrase [Lentisphaeria bacterium]